MSAMGPILLDISTRVLQALDESGHVNGEPSVGTIHSLVLRGLRLRKFIQTVPSDPQVLDDWEIRKLTEEEYDALHGTARDALPKSVRTRL